MVAHRDEWVDGEVIVPNPRPGVALEVRSRHAKPGWRPRAAGDGSLGCRPGTAVLYQGDCFEVRSHTVDAGGDAHRYELTPWEEGEVMAGPPRELSPQASAVEREARQAAERIRGQSLLVGLAAPLISLLPAPDQLRLERRWGLDACANVIRTALVTGVVGATLYLIGLAEHLGGEHTLLTRIRPWTALLLVDSLIRLLSMATGQPIGSLFVAAPLVVGRALRSLWHRGTLDETPTLIAQELRFDRFARAVDRVEIRGSRLIVHSLLAKPHWTLGRTAIRYDGRLWLAVDRAESRDDDGTLRFELEELPAAMVVASCIDYDPTEVRRLHRDQLRQQYQTWIETLAAVWGLLDPERKQKLEECFEFDALHATVWSARLELLIGGLLLLTGGGPFDTTVGRLLGAAAGVGLLVDGFRRRRGLARDQMPGSLLGWPLRGVADVLLRVGPR